MKYLMFSNKGNLDTYGLMVMGASTKRGDDNKIGEYGSGWKYAIAVLLRMRIEAQIYIGYNPVRIRTRSIAISGKEFSMIVVNGIDAMYTTDLGPDWTLWMALREIYCNSIDEGNNAVNIATEAEMMMMRKEDTTIVGIPITPEVQGIIDNWMDYFSFERTDDVLTLPGLKVFKKRGCSAASSIIYRKGIKVAESPTRGCYDYDFDNIPINEIRQAISFSSVEDALKRLMLNNISPGVLDTILSSTDTWEKKLHFYSWESMSGEASKTWTKTIDKRLIVPQEFSTRVVDKAKVDIEKKEEESTLVMVPATLAELISLQIPQITVIGFDKGKTMCFPTEIQEKELAQQILNEALDYLVRIYHVDRYNFELVDFANSYNEITHVGNNISVSADYCLQNDLDSIALLIFKRITLIQSGCKAGTAFENYLLTELYKANKVLCQTLTE